jgi:hypothetical protein
MAVRQPTLLLTGFLLLVLLTPLPADAKSTKAIWGPVHMPDGSSAFPVYRDLGVRVLQLELEFHAIARRRPRHPKDPLDPAYYWPEHVDEAILAAQRQGIRIALLARGSPGWANSGRAVAYAPRPRAFARFLTAASRRYPSVHHWMIWGETNRAAVFRPLPRGRPKGPRRYARLLAASYRALKRRNRRNLVIGGMTFSFGEVMAADFLRWMRLPNGRPPPLDLYGHNPFTRRFPKLSDGPYGGYPAARDFSELDQLHRDLRRTYRGRRTPKLWLSEFTISSDRANRDFSFYVSREDQARWITAAYRISRRTPWIASLGWFSLLDDPASDPFGRTTGLMTWEGERKPAYDAYRRAR